MRPARALPAALLCLGLVLTGCADQGGAQPQAIRPAGTAVESPSVTAPVAEQPPSLPPGDPGLDAPSVPDPGTAAPEHHDHTPRRTVPETALLAAEDVATALGGSWSRQAGQAEPCTLPRGDLARRTMAYTARPGRLTQSVLTYRDAAAADRAVRDLTDRLAGCGWSVGRDPRLGSTSVTASGRGATLTAVSVEGVAVVLVGAGRHGGGAAVGAGRWSWLVDLALGSSCPAAPDGCH
jgi:hypothetical protein